MVYLLLGAAIVSELVGTLSTRFSDGFTRVGFTVLAVAGVAASYWLLSLVLKHGMNIGVAYAIWAAVGVTVVALIGAAFLGDSLSPVQVFGLVLVVGGVLSLELGARH